VVDDACHGDSLSVGGDLRTVPLTGQTIKDYLLLPHIESSDGGESPGFVTVIYSVSVSPRK
jgi:hypothetical protein